MKKSIFTILIVFIFTFKIFSQQADSIYKRSIDLIIAPEKVTLGISQDPLNFIKKIESAYRIGFNYTISSSKKRNFELRTGLHFSQFKFIQTFSNFRSTPTIKNIEIPLNARIYLGQKLVRPYLDFSFALNKSLNQFGNNFITTGVGCGIDYCMYDDIALFIQPYVRKVIIQNNNNTRLNNFLSLEMGLKYRY